LFRRLQQFASERDTVTSSESSTVAKHDDMPAGPVSEQIVWLETRLKALRQDVDQHVQISEERQHHLNEAITRTAAELREQTRQIAIGGLFYQAWGLLLVTFGVVIAAVPTVYQ
jgi:hypothetical protein